MKITFFLNQFPVSSETFVINQISGLIKLGFDVDILAISKGDLNNNDKIIKDFNLLHRTTYLTKESVNDSVLQARAKRIISVLKPRKILKKLCAFNVFKFGIHSKSLLLPSIVSNNKELLQADVFIAHFGTAGVVANKMRQLGLLEGKLITIFHGADISVSSILQVFEDDYKALFEAADLLLPISELWKNRLIELGCPNDKIVVNRMGINCEKFVCREVNSPLHRPLKIISVARFIEKKGLADAIKAMHLLKGYSIDFHYTIIGDGELKSNIERLIVEYNLNSNVSLLGFQPQDKVNQLLQNADIFLLPSVTARNGDMEGIPVALMEAMAMGLITISTYHSGIPELICDQINGLLVPEHSPADLAKSLLSLDNGELDIPKMRKAAKLKVEESFEQSKLYQHLAELLVKVHER